MFNRVALAVMLVLLACVNGLTWDHEIPKCDSQDGSGCPAGKYCKAGVGKCYDLRKHGNFCWHNYNCESGKCGKLKYDNYLQCI